MALFIILGSVLLFPLGRLHASADLLTWFRYAFPIIFPFVVFLVTGWYGFLGFHRMKWIIRGMVGLNILAIWSVADFFYPDWADCGFVLVIVVISILPLCSFCEQRILGTGGGNR